MHPKVPKIAKSLVGYCEMIYDHQTKHRQCHKWWSTLVKMVREHEHEHEHEHNHAVVRTAHVVRNWRAMLYGNSLKTTTFAAVSHLASILRNGSYGRACCLASYYKDPETKTGHCIALLLEETGTHLRLLTYDPNGSWATTNPFRDPAIVEGVEASLARRLGRRVEIVPMVRDAVGVQQRTPIRYGLCTVFAAYGLARFLKDPTWSDTRWDVPELTTWCMCFADLMGMDYRKAPDVARQRLQSPPSLFECQFTMNFVNGDEVMVSRHRCKSWAAVRLWEARINETLMFKLHGTRGAKSCTVDVVCRS
jgi:hypothetical protein